jgi:hypothetical protein
MLLSLKVCRLRLLKAIAGPDRLPIPKSIAALCGGKAVASKR